MKCYLAQRTKESDFEIFNCLIKPFKYAATQYLNPAGFT